MRNFLELRQKSREQFPHSQESPEQQTWEKERGRNEEKI